MKKKHIIHNILGMMLCFTCVACNPNKETASLSTPTPQVETPHKIGNNTIDVTRLAGKGNVVSKHNVAICSRVEGIVKTMNLIDGQVVKKGQTLAVIDNQEMQLKLQELESELKKKAHDVNNILIGLGYKRDALTNVPKEVRQSAETYAGYEHTKVLIENVKKQMELYVIKAPFNGCISKLQTQQNGYIGKGETLFNLIDMNDLEVEFTISEALVQQFKIGMSIHFTTIANGDNVYNAELTTMAPIVENNGMIILSAKITDNTSELLPGMTALVNY